MGSRRSARGRPASPRSCSVCTAGRRARSRHRSAFSVNEISSGLATSGIQPGAANVRVGKLNKDMPLALRRGTIAQATTHHHLALDGCAWLRLASPGCACPARARPPRLRSSSRPSTDVLSTMTIIILSGGLGRHDLETVPRPRGRRCCWRSLVRETSRTGSAIDTPSQPPKQTAKPSGAAQASRGNQFGQSPATTARSASRGQSVLLAQPRRSVLRRAGYAALERPVLLAQPSPQSLPRSHAEQAV
jgi:hypothetical protein